MTVPTTPTPHNAPRISAYFGFALFLVGMAMVAYVFWHANTLLTAPPVPIPKVGTGPNGATEAGVALGASLTGLLSKLLVLLVMCIIGAVFASLGINALFAAWNANHPHKPSTP